jgi:two-component system chemotaxis response regulator CheB
MKKYKVLIVDDSAFMRKGISMVVEKSTEFEIVGVARNGKEAVEKVHTLQPDVVTMDIEMPEMNGIDALKQIMQTKPTPVVMLSALTDEGTKASMEALEIGAVDFFLKSNLLNNMGNQQIVHDFLLRLKTACQANIKKSVVATHQAPSFSPATSGKYECLMIGSSTGGPSALQKILITFPADFPVPVVIAQHMPPGFTKAFAERLNRVCALTVKEATNGEELKAGNVYIAPAGSQTTVSFQQRKPIITVHDHYPIEALYAPSVDITLESVASCYKEKLVTAILTGMGNDGTKGCQQAKRYNGYVLTESEETCVVYGMPKSVVEAGFSDSKQPIHQMGEAILNLFGK